ncbi:hypothetical protein OIU77_012055 [Salix suchowensis]|uniref:NAC domain-containing protein n=1 Tax=Salix suchowensis TaxID=1278906 RepID=A0ABQ9A2B2_9ROSI|nr:hypothetical protein OIU77_012055 [Salix suchowensis]
MVSTQQHQLQPSTKKAITCTTVVQEWPGLPGGVKFDPSDQEIIWHLLAKVGNGGIKPHPFIKEFIPTVENDDGICYTHPQNLPGVKQDGMVIKVDPVTPKSITPDPPRAERQCQDFDSGKKSTNVCTEPCAEHSGVENLEEANLQHESPCYNYQPEMENHVDQMVGDNDNCADEGTKWWDSESQHLLDSQQLVEGLSLCDEFLQSQSPSDGGHGRTGASGKSGLSDYAHLGPDHLKKDLEECQNLELDPANIELDTPPEFRLSQLVCCHLQHFLCLLSFTVHLFRIFGNANAVTKCILKEFGSQDSFMAWGEGRVVD